MSLERIVYDADEANMKRIATFLLGIGTYGQVNERSAPIETAEGLEVRVLTLDGLIAAKRARNRGKDRLHIIELEALADINRHRDRKTN